MDGAISSVERLRKSLSKSKTKQVAAHDEQAIVKATVWAWFKTCRPLMKALSGDGLLQAIDSQYQGDAESSEKATLRNRYLSELKHLSRHS